MSARAEGAGRVADRLPAGGGPVVVGVDGTSSDLATGVGLGSTALACVRQPPCPVVVLPDGSRG